MIDGDDITKISRTAIAEVDQNNSTTTFTNQNPTNSLSVLSTIPHDEDVINSSTNGRADQSIDSFMAKPVPIRTALIATINAAGTLLYRFSIASSLLSTSIWTEKLKGFINVRGTARVKLQLNANPFQAGRLILAYIPQYEHNNRASGQHLYNLMTITQLPHVEMSFQDTECELEVPYISPTTHFNMQSGEFDWGSVFLFVYSPFRTGAAVPGTIGYSIWLSFDDFEVETPIIPQSSSSSTQRGVIRKYRSKRIRSSLDSEINEGKGPISSALSSVSKISAGLAAIPMLTPIAGPLSWFTNLSSGVASAFGWSKPSQDLVPCRMVSNPHPYLANTNEADVTNHLGLIADNRVSVMPDVNLCGVDEMALSYIKRQKAYYKTISWTTSSAGLLDSFSVTPDTFRIFQSAVPYGLTTNALTATHAPVSFLARLFQYYRGSIELTFKIVKTQYHTGRLMVVFSPQSTNVVSPTYDQTNYALREIIDLRDGNEFCIRLPYSFNAMYAATDISFSKYLPKIYIYVLNELVAPESVASSVDILVEVRGGEDLEFQVPIPLSITPIDVISPQGAGDDQVEPVLCHTIGNAMVHDPSYMASQLCIGESCTSLLVLMKRYWKMSSDVTSWAASSRIELYPFTFGSARATGVAGAGTSAPLTFDYLSIFASMYAHSRGGIRYRFLCDAVSQSDTTVGTFIGGFIPRTGSGPLNLTTSNTTTGLGIPAFIGSLVRNGANTFDSSYSSGTSLTFPQYSRTYCRLNRLQIDNSTLSSDTDVNPLFMTLDSSQPFGANFSIMRCAADDFHFSFWLGIPPLGVVL